MHLFLQNCLENCKDNKLTVKSMIEAETVKQNKLNLEEVQFAALCNLEEGTPLPSYFSYKLMKRRKDFEFNFSDKQMLAFIISNPLAAMSFAKNPSRQSIAENIQINYLTCDRGFPIKRLPGNGSKSIRIYNGNLITGSHNPVGSTKTIDAVAKYDDYTDFICFKYVKDNGGAQDNQISDVINFLKAAIEYTINYHDNTLFTAVVDGDYIESCMEDFDIFCNDRVRVCTSETYCVV